MKNTNIDKLTESLRSDLLSKTTEASLIETKNIFVKRYLAPLYEELKFTPQAEKREFGLYINEFKDKINDIFTEIHDRVVEKNENEQGEVDYNIYIGSTSLQKGQLTPISLVTNEVIDFFKKMNFEIAYGDEVVGIKHNFENLNIDPSHPARDKKDSYYFDANTLLRTHCTSTTAELIENNQNDDIRILSYGNVYRNDDDDLTHSHQFNQVDFVWVKDGLSIRNLKWLIHEMLKHILGDDINVRFRLSHFPFTEPSFEVDASCTSCGGVGCPMCKHTGWIELLGAGMLHENVLQAANLSVKTGIAAGFGIDRIAMLKYGINDIRQLYTNDFRVLNQFKKGGK